MSKYHAGKQAERRHAKIFGTRRKWQTQAEGGLDWENDWLAGESFVRRIPNFLKRELEQVRLHAGDKLPIVVWHEKGERYEDDLVVIRLGDFLDYFER